MTAVPFELTDVHFSHRADLLGPRLAPRPCTSPRRSVGAGSEVVDDGAQRGDDRVRQRFGGRPGRGADIADGLADHGAHRGLIEGLQAAVGERRSQAVVSSATSPLRPETAIRARLDKP